jgi:broad specificity phosphatase PhoE
VIHYGARAVVLNSLRTGSFCLLLTLLPMSAASPAQNTDAAWAALAKGGHVALVRHAIAPGATDEPPGFTLDDCATQRNLDDEGRAQAAELGATFRTHGISVGRVISSPWCRCKDTATEMGFATFTTERAVGGMFPSPERRAEQLATFRQIVRAWRGPGTLLVVTHGTTIHALTGVSAYQAETVVLAPQTADTTGFSVVGSIPPP